MTFTLLRTIFLIIHIIGIRDTLIKLKCKYCAVKSQKWLDWGCGVGAVAKLLSEQYNTKMFTYDQYFYSEINALTSEQLIPRGYDLVLNTAVFEHVRSRDTLDLIESFVSDCGVLAIHTLVPENIQNDPSWMYLLPVHCAFHTNIIKVWKY